MTNNKVKDRNIKIFTSVEKDLRDNVNDKKIISKLESLRKKLKSIDSETVLVIYRQFVKIRSRQTIELEIEQDLPYYAYTSMRRSSKVKSKRIELSDDIKRKMIEFFLKTSIPKMLAE